jgi:hypothetical protein
MDELDPLEKRGPFENFQMAFMTIAVNTCPPGVRPAVLGAQIIAEVGLINMLTNDVLIPARDPGSLDGYTDTTCVALARV